MPGAARSWAGSGARTTSSSTKTRTTMVGTWPTMCASAPMCTWSIWVRS
jgi:hypothetical protein